MLVVKTMEKRGGSDMAERGKYLGSVYMVLVNADGQVFLQKRQGTNLWPGFWALPAGHLDPGEDAHQALVREAKEELGIELNPAAERHVLVVNRINGKDDDPDRLPPYFDVYFMFCDYDGNPKIMEPEKCSETMWVPIADLPDKTIGYEKEAIAMLRNKVTFAVQYVPEMN